MPDIKTNTAQVSIFAGKLNIPNAKDGVGEDVLFNAPCGMLINDAGYIFIAGSKNDIIRVIAPNGQTRILVGRVGIEGESDCTVEKVTFTKSEKIEFGKDQNTIIVFPQGEALDKKGFNKYRRILLDKNNPIPVVVKVETINNLSVHENNYINNLNKTNNADKQALSEFYSDLYTSDFLSGPNAYNYNPRPWGKYNNVKDFIPYIELKADLKARLLAKDKENNNSKYNDNYDPADPNKSAYAYASKITLIRLSHLSMIDCDREKIVYLVRPAAGGSICPEIMRANGSIFTPENRIKQVQAQNENNFYILKKNICEELDKNVIREINKSIDL